MERLTVEERKRAAAAFRRVINKQRPLADEARQLPGPRARDLCCGTSRTVSTQTGSPLPDKGRWGMTQKWMLVPVEPTDEMLERFGYRLDLPVGRQLARDGYVRLLRAAPPPSEEVMELAARMLFLRDHDAPNVPGEDLETKWRHQRQEYRRIVEVVLEALQTKEGV